MDRRGPAPGNADARIPPLFGQALAFHRQGQLAAAAALCRQVVALDPGHFDALRLLGLCAAQAGDHPGAERMFIAALARNPYDAGTLCNLGNIQQSLGRADAALASYDRAIALRPDLVQAHGNRGNALRALGRLDAAIESYDRAIALEPGHALAWGNRGIALQDLGRLAEAVVSYDRAIALKPDHFAAYYNRGNALERLGELPAALASYEKAIALEPDYAEAHYNRGSLLAKLHRPEEAVGSYDRALAARPAFPEAHNNRGNVLRDIKRLEAAVDSYDRAIALRPDYADAWYNRGHALQELGRCDEALASYDRAIALKPQFAEAHRGRAAALVELVEPEEARASYLRALEIEPGDPKARWSLAFTTIPPLFRHDGDPEPSRRAFAAALGDLELWFEQSGRPGAHEAVGSAQPFYLAYQERDNRGLLARYGALCHRIMGAWQQANHLCANPLEHKGRIRIGIVSEHVRNHSVWNAIVRGWTVHIDPQRFELHIFCIDASDDDETKLARAKATSFTQGRRPLVDWARAILAAGIEVLIYPEIGMSQLAAQLANLRLAPLQLASWGHPETTGLPTIDHYLSAELLEPPDGERFYTEELVRLPNLGCSYARQVFAPRDVDLAALGVRGDGPILVCAGTPFKYASGHDRILVETARRLGKCRFVFFTSRNRRMSSILEERLAKAFADSGLDFGAFATAIPWLDKEHFHGLLERADVMLDTVGFSGFNTVMRAVECGLPVVTVEGRFMRGRFGSAILRRMGLPELIARDDAEYVELVARLAGDAAFRTGIRERMRRQDAVLFDDLEPVRALERFLIGRCRPT